MVLLRKTLRDHLRGIVGWLVGVVILIVVQLWVYPTVRAATSKVMDFAEAFPEALRKVFRMDEYGTPIGYLSTELFSATLPLIFIAVGITWGARVATDEVEAGTADIVLSLPISRREYFVTRVAAMILVLTLLGAVLTAALAIGTPIVDMHIATMRLGAAALSVTLAGLVFGSVGLTIGAATGRRSMALGVSLAIAIAAFVVYSLAPLVELMNDLNRFNPMQWTTGARSLQRGVDVGYVFLSLLTASFFSVAGALLFDRRDIVT